MLGTPPAFILSQDQTLMLKFVSRSELSLAKFLNRSTVVLGFVLNVLIHGPNLWAIFIRIFRVLHTVQFSRFFAVVCDSQINLSQLFVFVNSFFVFIFEHSALSQRTLFCLFACPLLSLKDKAYLTTCFCKSQHLFYKVFRIVLNAYTICFSCVFVGYFYHIT